MEIDSDPEQCFLDKIDEPFPDVEISVVEGVPRGHGLTAYVGYIIKLKSPSQLTVQRRYSEFAALREVLVQRWPGVAIPCLPAKRASGSNSLKVVNERVKYLSYFLNNCVKLSFIFMSEEFQLFLTSSDPDLKTKLQKIPTLPYYLMLHRYQQAFRDINPSQERRGQVWLALRDQVEPFKKLLQGQKIALINLKRQVFKLALKRQEYLRTSKILFCDTLPNLEAHLVRTAQNVTAVLDSKKTKQSIMQFKERTASNYWSLFQCLKLQIGESQAAIEAIQSRQALQREQRRLLHDITVNGNELADIKAGKKTLKQFFSGNKEQLIAQLTKKNQELAGEVEALKLLNLMAAEVAVSQLVQTYRKRRQYLWRKVWRMFVSQQTELSQFMQNFYSLFLHPDQ